jgi:hypothetical protein
MWVARHCFELLVVLLSIEVLDLSIEAPPSVLPQRRYCDITGLEVRGSSESQFIIVSMMTFRTGPVHGSNHWTSLS